MNLSARAIRIREPLLRWPLFTLMYLWDMPEYFVGAYQHNRLRDPAFWNFTWNFYCAAMRGAFIDFEIKEDDA